MPSLKQRWLQTYVTMERHRSRNMHGRGMRGWEVSRREVRGLDAVFTGRLRTARRASYRFQCIADTLTHPYTTNITHWDDWLSVYELESRTGRPLFPSPPVPANILITPPCSRDKCVPVPAEGVSYLCPQVEIARKCRSHSANEAVRVYHVIELWWHNLFVKTLLFYLVFIVYFYLNVRLIQLNVYCNYLHMFISY